MIQNCIAPNCTKSIKHNGKYCTMHYFRLRNYNSFELPKSDKQQLFEKGLAKCASCKDVKSVNEFGNDSQTTTGKAPYCNICAKLKGKVCYKRHSKKASVRRLNKCYNLSEQQLLEMYVKQDYRCAICNKQYKDDKIGDRKLRVDHDHKTNKIRGLLCDLCNRGLGNFHDDCTKLSNAIIYLRKIVG